MKELQIKIKGTTPLLMHSDRMVNPFDQYKIELDKYTKKRKKTESDIEMINEISFLGSLYYNKEHGYHIPSKCIFASLESAGKASKRGKIITQSISLIDPFPKFLFKDDDLNPSDLYKKREYVDITTAVVQRSKIMRIRPIFNEWIIKTKMLLNTSRLDIDELKEIFEYDGQFCGLGDDRRHGYGRFEVEIK